MIKTHYGYMAMIVNILARHKQGLSSKDILSMVVSMESLSEEDCARLTPSGGNLLQMRLSWARTFLKKAGLVETPRRSFFRLTPRGFSFAKEGHKEITRELLAHVSGEFLDFVSPKSIDRSLSDIPKTLGPSLQVPTPRSEATILPFQKPSSDFKTWDIYRSLLESLTTSSPSLFREIIVSLLLALGYGGEKEHSLLGLSEPSRFGFQGVFPYDVLGLEMISLHVFCMPVERPVSSLHIRSVLDRALELGHRKLLIITPSFFTKEVASMVKEISLSCVLIDGDRLSHLMVENGLGVTLLKRAETFGLDEDFFKE